MSWVTIAPALYDGDDDAESIRTLAVATGQQLFERSGCSIGVRLKLTKCVIMNAKIHMDRYRHALRAVPRAWAMRLSHRGLCLGALTITGRLYFRDVAPLVVYRARFHIPDVELLEAYTNAPRIAFARGVTCSRAHFGYEPCRGSSSKLCLDGGQGSDCAHGGLRRGGIGYSSSMAPDRVHAGPEGYRNVGCRPGEHDDRGGSVWDFEAVAAVSSGRRSGLCLSDGPDDGQSWSKRR